MDNKITIDINDILSRPVHSVTDGEEIRQISLISLDQTGTYPDELKDEIITRIDPKFSFAALYPHVFFPIYNEDTAKEITAHRQNIMKELIEKRNSEKGAQ